MEEGQVRCEVVWSSSRSFYWHLLADRGNGALPGCLLAIGWETQRGLG